MHKWKKNNMVQVKKINVRKQKINHNYHVQNPYTCIMILKMVRGGTAVYQPWPPGGVRQYHWYKLMYYSYQPLVSFIKWCSVMYLVQHSIQMMKYHMYLKQHSVSLMWHHKKNWCNILGSWGNATWILSVGRFWESEAMPNRRMRHSNMEKIPCSKWF